MLTVILPYDDAVKDSLTIISSVGTIVFDEAFPIENTDMLEAIEDCFVTMKSG